MLVGGWPGETPALWASAALELSMEEGDGQWVFAIDQDGTFQKGATLKLSTLDCRGRGIWVGGGGVGRRVERKGL